MDQFEEARLRAQKRLERAARVTQKAAEVPQPIEVAPEAPKEKSVDTSAVFSVWVQLPDQAYALKLVKQGVYQNAVRSKLTKQAITNAIKEGLRPLLGAVNELPGGG